MRVGVFADVSNLYYCVYNRFNGKKLDYGIFLRRVVGENSLVRAVAYGASMGTQAANFTSLLQGLGYETKYKIPKRYAHPFDPTKEVRKADWDVGIAVDIVRSIDAVDGIIIGSADGDLTPLVEWVKDQGKFCDIVACGISRELKEAANCWQEIGEEYLQR